MSRSLSFVAAFVACFALSASDSAAQTIKFGPGGIVVTPGRPFHPIGQRPSRPVYVTPDQFNGFNPQTGGVDTWNRQINDTAFDFGRNESQHNGTKRWVRRPVYGLNGQIVGYEEGYVWNNSYTGQEHGNLNTYTPNGNGGVHTGNVVRSVNPNAGGVHTQNRVFATNPNAGGVHTQKRTFSAKPSAGGVHTQNRVFAPSPKP